MNRPAIVIPCWDNYQWLWEYWDHYFQKHWCHDIGWPVYFVTEEKETRFAHTISLQVGKCDSMERVRRSFESVNADTIFLLQEDMIPKKKVDGKIFQILFETFIYGKMNSLRIQHQCPHTTYNKGSGTIEQIPHTSDYFFSFQPGLFNKEYFLDVTKESKSLWDMELKGTKELYKEEYKDTVYIYEHPWYEELVRQGKWRKGKLAQAAERGIKL